MQEEFVVYLVRKYGHQVVNEIRARIYKVDPVKDWKKLEAKFNVL